MIYYLTAEGLTEFQEAVSKVGDTDLQQKLHFTQTEKDIDTMITYTKEELVSKAQEFIEWISGVIDGEFDNEALETQIETYITKKQVTLSETDALNGLLPVI